MAGYTLSGQYGVVDILIVTSPFSSIVELRRIQCCAELNWRDQLQT